MYNVIKVADLVQHFGAACQRHGLCDEATFPPNFVSTIKALEMYLDMSSAPVPLLIFTSQRVTSSSRGYVALSWEDKI